MRRRLTTESFVQAAREVHGDRYDYSQVEFTGMNNHVTIICPKHGPFPQRPYDHLRGMHCKRCSAERAQDGKRLDTEKFIRRAREVHDDRYDYSQAEYVNMDTAVAIICPKHGPFKQIAYDHLKGRGCEKCAHELVASKKRGSTADFIARAKAIHGDRYDYSLVEYVSTESPVTIICPVHGPFRQSPHSHLSGCGCRKCGRGVCGDKLRNSKADFLRKARAVHGDKYDYSLVEYVDERKHVKIVCPTHGVFSQTPTHHLQGHGCRKCFADQMKHVMQNHLRTLSPPPRKTTVQFIADARRVHGDLYDYSQTEYIRDDERVTVVCRKHGPFRQKANSHLNGAGCPVCRASKGELRISKWLQRSGLQFETEVVIRSRFAPGKRKFFKVDFLVKTTPATIIEYNGAQHYASIEGWGGDEGYDYRKLRDERLVDYCKQKSIRLIVIPYTDFDRIEEILDETFQAATRSV